MSQGNLTGNLCKVPLTENLAHSRCSITILSARARTNKVWALALTSHAATNKRNNMIYFFIVFGERHVLHKYVLEST